MAAKAKPSEEKGIKVVVPEGYCYKYPSGRLAEPGTVIEESERWCAKHPHFKTPEQIAKEKKAKKAAEIKAERVQ